MVWIFAGRVRDEKALNKGVSPSNPFRAHSSKLSSDFQKGFLKKKL